MANDLTQDEIDARQQLNEAIKQASAEMAASGRVSAATQSRLDNSTKVLTRDFDSLGSSLTRLSKSYYEGNTSAGKFNDSITSSANVAATYLGSKGPLGLAVGKLVQVLGKYVNAVNKQADQLFDSYQDLADAGATGARGITEVFENMQKFGYTVNELSKFSAVIRANSETLAVFGGTAASGARAFGEITKALQYGELGEEFTRMGLTVDGVNTGLAGFLKIQQLSGVTSKKTTAELVQSSTDYIKELDLLAKMTGQSRASVQAQNEKALQQEQFAAYQFELQQQISGGGAAGDLAKAQLDNVTKVYQSMANQPGIQKGFLNSLTGNLTDPDTIKFMQAMPRAYAESQKKIIDINNFSVAAQKDTAAYLKGSGTALAKLGASDLIGPKFQEIAGYNSVIATGLKEKVEQGKIEQNVTDASTDSMAAMKIASRDTTNNLQSLVNIGVQPVTASMMILDKVIRGITGIPGAVVAPLKPSASSDNMLGRSGTGGAATGLDARRQAEKYLGNPISDSEFSALIKATHAEAAGGKKASQQEQAMIMASVLNRARTDQGGIMGALNAKNQFQSVTGTANAPGPSQQYLKGPEQDRLKSIEGATKLLQNISLQQKNFTAADANAYGPGTNINYRDKMLAAGGTVVGGSVFQTAMSANGGYKFGGIATGPDSGYETTLHGTEAVVPLPNGNSIPVEIQGNNEQMGVMSAQLSRLDDIVRVMQTQLAVSQKLLQYAQ
jgi:hypothetical protein